MLYINNGKPKYFFQFPHGIFVLPNVTMSQSNALQGFSEPQEVELRTFIAENCYKYFLSKDVS